MMVFISSGKTTCFGL